MRNGKLFVESSNGIQKPVQAKVFTHAGRLVGSFNPLNKSTYGLPGTGVYLIRILSADNKKVYTYKVAAAQ